MLQLQGHQPSLLQALLGRELRGGSIHKRPFVAEFRCEGACSGTVTNNPGLTGTPAFAAEYSKVYNNSKLLAIADEEGYVSIVDTSCELPTEMADDWSANKPRAQWLAHRNAVFDLAWCKDDSQMLTASGDQTISLWDTGLADLLGSFRGHSGSVKAVCPMPASHSVFASGARDGALLIWDSRVAATPDSTTGELFHSPVITVQDAHALNDRQRRRRTPLQGRTRPSVTSLTFLQGPGNQLATGGVDGVVKFWDLRQSAAAAGEAAPALDLARLCDAGVPPISQKQHGITSLALHPQGSQLLVSLTGGHHLIYDPLRPNIGPTRWFGGHTVASFYVKAAWSPDGSHIVSGSTDRNVYIWEVDAADGASPYVLPGHQGEVTAVAWCPTDFQQIATTADDATVKVWQISRQQPEEQAHGAAAAGAAAAVQEPWVYPWQRQQHLHLEAPATIAAAAAEAAEEELVEVPHGATTPASAAAAGGSATPWSAQRRQQQQQQQPPSENTHVNLGGQLQQQQAGGASDQAAAAAAAAPSGPGAAVAVAVPPATAGPVTAAGTSAGRLPLSTPFRVRSIGDLLQQAPSTRRTNKQMSIASFLRSPAAAGGAGSTAGKAAGGGSTAGKAGGGGSSRRRARDLGGTGSAAAMPLPGLAGSCLPPAKRLRVAFGSGSSSSPFASRGAALLDPSPEAAAAAAAGTAGSAAAAAALEAKAAAAAGSTIQRQGSDAENALIN